jgi:hypothetical protein
MSKCEICGNKAKITYTCNGCGAKFCEKCGDHKKLTCQDCIGYDEESKGGYKPEQEIEIEIEDTE